MAISIFVPEQTIKDAVEYFWVYEGTCPDPAEKARVLPDGAIEIVFSLTAAPLRLYDGENGSRVTKLKHAWLFGQKSRSVVIGHLGKYSLVGIRFLPGGARQFLEFPVHEILDSIIELDACWGRMVTDTKSRLQEAASAVERVRLLKDFLLQHRIQRYESCTKVAFVLQRMHKSMIYPSENATISSLAKDLGITNKRLTEIFERSVGMSPKRFKRILRFQKALVLLRNNGSHNFAYVAADCGYYDQSHMIKDFEMFTGMTPTSYLLSKGDLRNYLLLS
jgi:AraC-like DNA-binding protein